MAALVSRFPQIGSQPMETIISPRDLADGPRRKGFCRLSLPSKANSTAGHPHTLSGHCQLEGHFGICSICLAVQFAFQEFPRLASVTPISPLGCLHLWYQLYCVNFFPSYPCFLKKNNSCGPAVSPHLYAYIVNLAVIKNLGCFRVYNLLFSIQETPPWNFSRNLWIYYTV